MEVKVTKNYNKGLPNRAASFTQHDVIAKAPNKYWFRNEHSPIRLFRYEIELTNLPLFVSTHLIRHGKFAEHFAQTQREDLSSKAKDEGRNTPTNHFIETNAQELINISKRRLCYKSHSRTVAIWSRICKAIKREEPDLYPFLVPECVYRNGICPERTECSVGLKNVMSGYKHYPLLPANN